MRTDVRRRLEALEERKGRPSARVPEDPIALAGALGLELDPWQADLLRSTSDRVLLNCSRQSGKSTIAGVVALHRALCRPGSLVLILAPSERQAKETFSKVAVFYRLLGKTVATDSHRKMGMVLSNSSRIEALPGTEKTIRGFSGVDLLILDEASRVPDELYQAVRPMLAVSGGTLMMLSTPFGRRGVYFTAWEHGGDSWERYEVPASMCPRITPEFLEEERKALPGFVFRAEYECSFEDTEDQLFPTDLIHAAVSNKVAPLFPEGLDYDDDD
jgi:hypothetical protein